MMFKKLLLFSFSLLLTAGHTQCDEQQKYLEEQLAEVQKSKNFMLEMEKRYLAKNSLSSYVNSTTEYGIILRSIIRSDKYLHKLYKKERKLRLKLANLKKQPVNPEPKIAE